MEMREESAFAGEPLASRDAAADHPSLNASKRLPILDGWRATSILLVLVCHLVPLPPRSLQLNAATGAMGMALFFTLSGFLITRFLAGGMPIHHFLARRLARIIPLCWTALLVLIIWDRPDPVTAIRNLLFVANLPPITLLHGGEHLWSLGVEMQFYICVALICGLFGRRGLYALPLLALAVTCARVAAGERISIVTWHRVDEILAGGVVALIYIGWFGRSAAEALKNLPVWPFALALCACSLPYAGMLMYFRPYAAALLVGASLSNSPPRLERLLISRPMAYIAEVSYALYVIHGILTATWLGSGSHLIRDLKRPLLIAVTFALAHVSTRYFEQPITRAVRRFTKRASAARERPLLVSEDIGVGASERPFVP